MTELRIPDLSFPNIPVGSHGAPLDLRLFLYPGAAAIERRKVGPMVDRGELGKPVLERLPLLTKIHDVLQAKLVGGGTGAAATVASDIGNISRFVSWIDRNNYVLTVDGLLTVFDAWVESLIRSYQIEKTISQQAAYLYAARMADVVGRVCDVQGARAGRTILKRTRMRNPYVNARGVTRKSDKQSLDSAFKYGSFLADLCKSLTSDVVAGPLPIRIEPRIAKPVFIRGYLKQTEEVPKAFAGKSRQRAKRLRSPLSDKASAIEERPSVLNIRIEAELAVFVAQTGMNLTQAARLHHERYRWQTDGDEVRAFRVYKGRRSGEVIFRCFKIYREHLQRYLTWLDEIGLSSIDERLFPFIIHKRVIPSGTRIPGFGAIKMLCSEAGVTYVSPRSLRKTRVNWLIRRTKDSTLTAAMAAHTEETLLRQYEEPHFQAVVVEITRFHLRSDPAFTPSSGDGLCARSTGAPLWADGSPEEAPSPDCISPEGCLFCAYHRDVMSKEYCWKLASHSRLKILELSLYRPSVSASNHPATAVVDRIEAKLISIAGNSRVHEGWVKDARDAIRSEHYHPTWSEQIQLLESLLERA